MYTAKKQNPKLAFRVFVSSTYSDMLPYRDAIKDAINKADCLSYGMERFGAESVPPLQKCYEELAESQIFVLALGMRYGSIDPDSGKSYTELEYDKARELGLPVLAFLIDEEQTSFKTKDIDFGESADKLRSFKESIMNEKEVTVAFFSTPDSLGEGVYRSLVGEIKRQGIVPKDTLDLDKGGYLDGCELFDQFVKRPEIYKNSNAILRVRMDGKYGGWLLRESLFEGFGFTPGAAMFLNDIYVLGKTQIDVAENIWHVDCFADGPAADWLSKNAVTTGTVFEGEFCLAYKTVKNISGIPMANGNTAFSDAKIAALILLEGRRVIRRNAPTVPGLDTDEKLMHHLLGPLVNNRVF